MRRLLSTLALMLLFVSVLLADVAPAQADDEKAIRETIQAYTSAFNAKDADRLAEHWAPEAVYINRTSGQRVKGRDAIHQQFKEMFRDAGDVNLSVNMTSLRVVSDTAAIEEGRATFVSSDSPPVESDYMAVYVKKDGKWLLDTVREVDLPQAPSNHQHLQELAWMIGEWVDHDDNATVRTKCEWTKNKNFIKRSFSMSVKDRVEIEGTQIIGYDAANGQIRSWVFDSDGSFGEGVWTRDGDKWTVNATANLSDGRRGAHTRVITYIDNDTFTLQTVHREIDGQLQPNIEEFRVVRVGSNSESAK